VPDTLIDLVVFGVTAFLVLASAVMVVLNRHPIYSALYLVLTFVGLSVFYLQLQAPFLAAVQVIVYAGAIMVLFLFVIMLLGEDKPLPGEGRLGLQAPLGILLALGLVAEIVYLLVNRSHAAPVKPADTVTVIGSTQPVPFGSVGAIGNTLFTQYLFAFEATSVVLLIAMIGVVVLAKRRL
jgi:NADH-quinone oxidoreductase subunit J